MQRVNSKSEKAPQLAEDEKGQWREVGGVAQALSINDAITLLEVVEAGCRNTRNGISNCSSQFLFLLVFAAGLASTSHFFSHRNLQ